MARVELDSVSKVYSNGFAAVTDLSLDIIDGEFLVLVGPSGCGKSTALRMIAGLEEISSGELRIGDRRVNSQIPPGASPRCSPLLSHRHGSGIGGPGPACRLTASGCRR